MTTDDLLDALADLQHDLGKYTAMPVTMLSTDATDADLREAVRVALRETRRSPTATRSAGEIWDAFLAEVGDALAGSHAWEALCTAVDRARAWELRLPGNAPLDRGAVTGDLCAISTRIRALTAEILEAP